MKKENIIFYSILGVVLLSGTLAVYLINKKQNEKMPIADKNDAIDLIIKSGKAKSDDTKEKISNRSIEYILSWANAIKNEADIFYFNDKKYDTSGGQLKK